MPKTDDPLNYQARPFAGRPSVMTAAVLHNIRIALEAGATEKDAAEFAEIGYATFQDHKTHNRDFRDAVTKWKANARLLAIGAVMQAARQGDWKAAVTWLERRYPEEWGKRQRLDLVIRREAEQLANLTGQDADWILQRAEEIAQAVAEQSGV